MAEATSRNIPYCTSYLISRFHSTNHSSMTKHPHKVLTDRRTDRIMNINPSLLKDSSLAFITLHIIRIPNVKREAYLDSTDYTYYCDTCRPAVICKFPTRTG